MLFSFKDEKFEEGQGPSIYDLVAAEEVDKLSYIGWEQRPETEKKSEPVRQRFLIVFMTVCGVLNVTGDINVYFNETHRNHYSSVTLLSRSVKRVYISDAIHYKQSCTVDGYVLGQRASLDINVRRKVFAISHMASTKFFVVLVRDCLQPLQTQSNRPL